ncbi:MAG: flagellar hook-associated protein 3, partial [Rhodoferax sp.]
MLHATRDEAYDIKVGPAASLLLTDTIKVTDVTLVTGSSYEISAISIGLGTTAGTSMATYDLIETPAGATMPLPPVRVSGPEYSSVSKQIPITIRDSTNPALTALSFNVSGSFGVGDSLTINPVVSLFSVLDNAINDIGSASSDNSASQAVGQALHNIDISMERVSVVRGQAGELLNQADRIT